MPQNQQPDIRNQLVTGKKSTKAANREVAEPELALEIPELIPVNAPEEVKAAKETSDALNLAQQKAQMRRDQEDYEQAMFLRERIHKIDQRILQRMNSPWEKLLDDFGSEENDLGGMMQERQGWMHELTQLTETSKHLTAMDKKKLAIATAPVDNYIAGLKTQQQIAQASSAVSTAYVHSNQARNSAIKQHQDSATNEEWTEWRKNGYKDAQGRPSLIFTQKADVARMTAFRKNALDIEASELANKEKRTDLADKLQRRALDRTPLGTLRQMADEAKRGKGMVMHPDHPERGQAIPAKMVLEVLKEKLDFRNKSMFELGQLENRAKQNNEVNSTLQEVANIMNVVSPNGSVIGYDGNDTERVTGQAVPLMLDGMRIQDMDPSGRLNDKTFDVSNAPPQLQGALADVVAAANAYNMDENDTNFENLRGTGRILKQKVEAFQKADIESSHPLEKGAKQQYYLKRRVDNFSHAADWALSNPQGQRNFKDIDIDSTWSIMMANVAEILEGNKIDWGAREEDEGISKEEVVRALLSQENRLLKGEKGRETLRKAANMVMTTRDGKKITPLKNYVQNKLSRAAKIALVAMAKKYETSQPEVSAYLNNLAKNTVPSQHHNIAQRLVAISRLSQANNSGLPDNVLGEEFMAELTTAMQEKSAEWGNHSNVDRSVFFQLLGIDNLANMLDTSAGAFFGAPIGMAWQRSKGLYSRQQLGAGPRQGPPVTLPAREAGLFTEARPERFAPEFLESLSPEQREKFERSGVPGTAMELPTDVPILR